MQNFMPVADVLDKSGVSATVALYRSDDSCNVVVGTGAIDSAKAALRAATIALRGTIPVHVTNIAIGALVAEPVSVGREK